MAWFRDHSSRYSTNSSRLASAQWMSSKTSTTGLCSLRRSKYRRQAAKRSSRSDAVRSSSPSRWARRGSSHVRSSGIGDVLLDRLTQLGARRAGLLALGDTRSHANHLRQRPVRDALAVGQAAPPVPEDEIDEAVDVLLELPDDARLPHAADPDDRDQVRVAVVGRGVEEVLDQTELAVATDERRLQSGELERAAPVRRHAERLEERDRLRLALQLVLALRARRRSPPRSPASSTHRRAPAPARPAVWMREAVLTRSPATMPWPSAPIVTAASPVSTPARAWSRRVELRHGRHQVERSPHRPLGVVLLRHRRPPDRHHRVADELLDRAAVALDQRPRRLEVARQQLPRLLRIPALGRGREPDQVGEQDRHEAPLRGRCRRLGRRCGGRRRLRAERRAALAAELHRRRVRRPARRTRLGERAAALAAELAAGVVLEAAGAADHAATPA